MSQIQGKWIADKAITQAKLADGTFVFNGLTSNGPIGINTNPPRDDLHIYSDTSATIRLDSSSGRAYQFRSDAGGNLVVRDLGAGADRVSMDHSGNVTSSVKINNSLEALYVGINATPDPTQTLVATGPTNADAVLTISTGPGDATYSSKLVLDNSTQFTFQLYGVNAPVNFIAGIPTPAMSAITTYGSGPVMIATTGAPEPIYLAPNGFSIIPKVTVLDGGVGIDTTAPVCAFEVVGDSTVDGNSKVVGQLGVGAADLSDNFYVYGAPSGGMVTAKISNGDTANFSGTRLSIDHTGNLYGPGEVGMSVSRLGANPDICHMGTFSDNDMTFIRNSVPAMSLGKESGNSIITFGATTSDRVNFIAGNVGYGGTATGSAPTIVSYYGGDSTFLGKPSAWIGIEIAGVPGFYIPVYG